MDRLSCDFANAKVCKTSDMAKQIVLTNVKRGGRNRYTLFIYYTVSGSPSKKRRIVYSSVFCTGLRKRLGLDAILALQRLCCPFPKNFRWYVYIMGKRKTVAAFYYVRG